MEINSQFGFKAILLLPEFAAKVDEFGLEMFCLNIQCKPKV
jgi:hypothetical protein